MKESWRWFGHLDKIGLVENRQTGESEIVTALREIPYGEIWERAAIVTRHSKIKAGGPEWTVVESLPVNEDIKRGAGVA